MFQVEVCNQYSSTDTAYYDISYAIGVRILTQTSHVRRNGCSLGMGVSAWMMSPSTSVYGTVHGIVAIDFLKQLGHDLSHSYTCH
jgi:hypothetical protein